MEPDDERLERLLGGDALSRLRARLRKRYAAGVAPADRFSLGNLTEVESAALAGLLGRAPRARASMQLSHAELDAALANAGLAANLRAALEALDGPIIDTAAARVRWQQGWLAVCRQAVDPRLAKVLAGAAGQGLLKRLSGRDIATASALITRADAVLVRLPAKGISLAQLAADTLGNAHALDFGHPVATLVRRALADIDPAARTRELWAAEGVLVNELAKPVAVLNLGVDGAAVGAELLRTATIAGEPLHLSLRLLTRHAPAWQSGQRIFVCENPAVLAAAADAFGARCPPMVSLDGQLSAAPRTLLDQLSERDAVFHYHGDFDWGGLAIANVLFARYRVVPWRFDAAHYRPTDGPPLQGTPVAASWDDALGSAMQNAGIAIHEESQLGELLADLLAGSGAPA